MSNVIYFHSENISFTLKQKRKIRKWLQNVFSHENKVLNSINIIFCNDSYLQELNVTYLKHNTLTDVITFEYTENNVIAGDIYISIPQVKENAKKYKTTFSNELFRVMVHGGLHLIGYQDKTPQQQKQMRKKEDIYLRNILL